MAGSTTNLDTISSSQASKEVTANALFDAGSPATLYGRRATTTTALTWGFYGGVLSIGGVLTVIANGTVALTASNTNYVEANPATGVVTANITSFTTGYIKLYSIVAGASTVTSYIDYRCYSFSSFANFAKTIIGDPGSEGAGIDINGVTYESTFKVSDINGTNYAQTILHRHSTTLEPLIVGARSNSNTSTHGTLTTSQNILTIYAAGWSGTHYDLFGSESFSVGTGTVSSTSSPGMWKLNLTPDSSNTPVAVITCDSDKSALFAGSVKVAGASLGYTTGAGGTVAQTTSKATGVTLDKACGTITMNNATVGATTSVGFTLTNSVIAITDTIIVNIRSGATVDSYTAMVDTVGAGSCRISLRNYTGGALAEAVVLNFSVIKAVAA